MIAEPSTYFSCQEGRERKKEDSTLNEATMYFFSPDFFQTSIFKPGFISSHGIVNIVFIPVIILSIMIYFLYSLLTVNKNS